MFKKIVSFVVILATVNLTSVMYGASSISANSSESSLQNSSENSSETTTQNSSDSSTQGTGESAVVLLVIGGILVVGGITIGVISTVQRNKKRARDAEKELNALLDEAARVRGHNIEIMAKFYEINKKDVADVITKAYINGKIVQGSAEKAMKSIQAISADLVKKSKAVNKGRITRLERIKNNPVKAKIVEKAYREAETVEQFVAVMLSL